jgi:four helix bundle protein
MKYNRFEELPVWQAAVELADRVFRLVDDRSFNGRGDLRNQLQRAATSISNNVAEGFERGTTQELITFVYYARGSAGEVRSMLHLCDRLPYFGHLKSEISDLRSLSESISRQLRAWADSLQNTDIKGQRYLSERLRQEHEQKRREEAFLAQLDRVRSGAASAAPGAPSVVPVDAEPPNPQ